MFGNNLEHLYYDEEISDEQLAQEVAVWAGKQALESLKAKDDLTDKEKAALEELGLAVNFDEQAIAATAAKVAMHRINAFRRLAHASLNEEQAAERLKLSTEDIQRLRSTNQLLAIDSTRPLYPDFQFTENGTLPGLNEVLVSLKDCSPLTVEGFFNRVNEDSDYTIAGEPVSRRQWLLTGGNPALVVTDAEYLNIN